ncbi:MAG TPA: hypothetical protein G4O12_05190 [Dehalococcoidia bacterium]|nr:hypothetical protein [Dehalococcoidia bacterium]
MKKCDKWYSIVLMGLVLLLASSLIACQPALSSAPPVEPADTTSPPPIGGFVATDAYDGKVNLSWDKSMAEDFDHYSIYVSKSEITDVNGMTPAQEIADIITNRYQVTQLETGTKYYFAVTAVDKSDNENTSVACVSAMPTPMPRGTVDPDVHVEVYQSDMAWPGTTLLPDNYDPGRPRIIEVNMLGEIIWEYLVPHNLKQYTNPGFDVELLPNNNILFVLPRRGVYEIDRKGRVVWSYLTDKISHDADRLPNGNTIFVYGASDHKNDAQIIEVNQKGEVVWSWYAKDHFDKSPYASIYDEGWTHTNAVTRLPDGNTLISPRNFNFMVEVDSNGSVVRTIGEGILEDQHDPEILSDGNILVANHVIPHQAIEIDPKTSRVVWKSAGFERDITPVRDADRLPNGNTLITGTTRILEVTAEGKTAWQLSLKDVIFETPKERPARGFYKAERIGTQR